MNKSSSTEQNKKNNFSPGGSSRSVLYMPVIFLILAIPFLFINQLPVNDVAFRYAPMAEEFARGEWSLAFHPRFGLLFGTLSGSIVYLTGLDGFRSCQLASLLLFTAATYPLYGLFKRIFNESTAVKGMILYLFCSHLLRIPLEGLRDSGKTLGFVLSAYGLIVLYQQRKKLAGYIFTALGCAVLTMIRGDGALIALVFLLFMLVLDILVNRAAFYRSILAGAIFLLLLLPQMCYVGKLTGYPVPDSRHAQLLKKASIPPLTEPELELP